jgi:formyltetrahydrofolate synthetase
MPRRPSPPLNAALNGDFHVIDAANDTLTASLDAGSGHPNATVGAVSTVDD